MNTFTYKDLIDVAIGTPESGHVNFYALHIVLSNFAQKLDCLDEAVEQDECLRANLRLRSSLSKINNSIGSLSAGRSSGYRLYAGEGDDVPPTDQVEVPPATEVAVTEPIAAESEAAVAQPEIQPAAADDDAPPAEVESELKASTAPVAELPQAVEEVAPMPQDTPVNPLVEPEPEPEPEPVEAKPESMKVTPTPPSRGSSRASKIDKTPSKADSLTAGSLAKLERRISRVELQKEQKEIELQSFLSGLTGQLRLTIEQMNNVTHMVMDPKPNKKRMQLIRQVARQLRALMRVSDDERSISWISGEAVVEEIGAEEEEEVLVEEQSSASEVQQQEQAMDLEQNLCYSPERMLDEVLELKSDLCALTNKVNELTAEMLKQDATNLIEMMNQMQAEMRVVKFGSASTNESNTAMQSKLGTLVAQINGLKNSVAHLDNIKVDKADVDLLLAEKVDFPQLATKVSIEQLMDYKEQLEQQFCEMRHLVSVNEKNVLQVIDGLRMTLGIDSLELSLKDFRDLIEKRVAVIAEALHKYMELTNDECAAAAGRVKVMQDLACISCDTPCVMRTVERSKLPLPVSAHASPSTRPLVTYELGQIRKSGIMGYYRKDEFPHSTNAWKQGTIPVSKCVPRHAGGVHTVHTAQEHVQKVVHSMKNTGWI